MDFCRITLRRISMRVHVWVGGLLKCVSMTSNLVIINVQPATLVRLTVVPVPGFLDLS